MAIAVVLVHMPVDIVGHPVNGSITEDHVPRARMGTPKTQLGRRCVGSV